MVKPCLSASYDAARPAHSAITVSNGLFLVMLDFGSVFTGTNYWLEIGVRTNGNGVFTTLAPRQPITPTPYAIFAEGASNVVGVLHGVEDGPNLLLASHLDTVEPTDESGWPGSPWASCWRCRWWSRRACAWRRQ